MRLEFPTLYYCYGSAHSECPVVIALRLVPLLHAAVILAFHFQAIEMRGLVNRRIKSVILFLAFQMKTLLGVKTSALSKRNWLKYDCIFFLVRYSLCICKNIAFSFVQYRIKLV